MLLEKFERMRASSEGAVQEFKEVSKLDYDDENFEKSYREYMGKQINKDLEKSIEDQYFALPNYFGYVKKQTNIVWFTWPGLYKNAKQEQAAGLTIARLMDPAEYTTQDKTQIKPQGFRFVEQESIDYESYSELPLIKKRLSVKRYKDGILIVSPETGKESYYAMTINFTGKKHFDFEKESPENTIILLNNSATWDNLGEIDFNDPIFDKGKTIPMYIVFPKINKTLATKFYFKDNVHFNKLINFFRSKEKVKTWPGEFKYFRQEMSVYLDLFRDWKDSRNEDNRFEKNHIENLKEKLKQCSNLEFLKMSYNFTVSNAIAGLLKKHTDEQFLEKINKYKKLSLKELYNLPKTGDDYKYIRLVYLLYFTNKGTTLVDGTPIDYENKTKVDCYYYWKGVQVPEMYHNSLNQHNFPLWFMNGKNFNELDFNHKEHTFQDYYRPSMELTEKTYASFKFKNQHILDEAMDSQTGYMMPYDGVWPIKGDPYFTFMKFRENEEVISVLICDENERYVAEFFDKKEREFGRNILRMLGTEDNLDLIQEIYTKIAGVIRDAKVLVERDSTMGYRGKVSPHGCKTESKYHTYYYPRVRYIKNPDKDYSKREKEYQKESRVFSGSRRAHVRKLPEGSKPSKLQILLAKKAEMLLPPNHTYVKSSVWGENGMTQKEKRYRSKSIDGLFYYNKEEMDKATEIGYLSPAGFEEYCEKYLSQDKWKITERSNHDGGIDIRALKEFKDGSIKSLLVQCKHWKTPIPPGEMRDFITACNLEKTEHEKVKMFITSSKFSPKARSLAEEHNIELIDGDILLG
jgi:hypothetical protein